MCERVTMCEWEARYKAVLTGIDDQQLIQSAEKMVRTAMVITTTSPTLRFHEVMTAMLDAVIRLRSFKDISEIMSQGK